MPLGFDAREEAQLHKAERLIPSRADRLALTRWWLEDARPTSRTPTWDIASTCSIDGHRGLLLVEAKAYPGEMTNEGKRFHKDSSKANHASVGRAIAEANEGLRQATELEKWHLSSTSCYQMSNRFAWSWKLCKLGYSVALVYLGFLDAIEMPPAPFDQDSDWLNFVTAHSAPLFPSEIWNQRINIDGVSLTPLIRSLRQPLDCIRE
jgi:hypothetical protein